MREGGGGCQGGEGEEEGVSGRGGGVRMRGEGVVDQSIMSINQGLSEESEVCK